MEDTNQADEAMLVNLKKLERSSAWGERMSWSLTAVSLMTFALYVYTLASTEMGLWQVTTFVGCMILSGMALRSAFRIRKSTREVKAMVQREQRVIEERRTRSEGVPA